MQRIINDPDQVVPEMLTGFFGTHRDLVFQHWQPEGGEIFPRLRCAAKSEL